MAEERQMRISDKKVLLVLGKMNKKEMKQELAVLSLSWETYSLKS